MSAARGVGTRTACLFSVSTPRGVVALCVMLALVAVASASAAAAYPRPGATERVSVASDGAQANDRSVDRPAISADGRYVAFSSPASNLVPGEPSNECPGFQAPVPCWHVFVHDRATGVTERVSVASDGTQAERHATNPAISADGRYVAFQSTAANLAPDVTNGVHDIFVRDRVTGITERVSVASDGREANGGSLQVSISADGRSVAFTSVASNLVPDDTNGEADVFVHDREAGTTERVSVASDGTEANDQASAPSISADGRHVAFQSSATNLVPHEPQETHKALDVWDVFVHDRETGTTERVSVASDGSPTLDGSSSTPAVSADGRHVAFLSYASNLVPGTTNAYQDVFVHDRETGVTERVSVASDATEADEGAIGAGELAVSADGRHVAFASESSNLAAGDTVGRFAVFLHDRETKVTERISVATDGSVANGISTQPAVSGDGRFVAFLSEGSNLVPDDTNGVSDVFVRDRGPALGVGGLSAALDGDAVSVSGWATLSGAVVTSVADPPDDGADGAEAVGAELTGAGITYRPEQEDLLVPLQLASLPPALKTQQCGHVRNLTGSCAGVTGGGGGGVGVVYGLEFELDEVRYEVRAVRVGATGANPDEAGEPRFAVYRCEESCVEVAALSGGIGTTGDEVLVSLPLSTLQLAEGTVLQAVRAYTAFGDSASGGVTVLDEADLPDGIVPVARVWLGIAPRGTPVEEVAFDTEAVLGDGTFSGIVEVASASPGGYAVWARACLGQSCGPTVSVDVGDGPK